MDSFPKISLPEGPTANVLLEVAGERILQDSIWGEQNHTDLRWLPILMEEVGEAANEINEGPSQAQLRSELVQVAAVAVAWIERLDRRG